MRLEHQREGTRRVLDFAAKARGLRSLAYVAQLMCRRAQRLIKEDELAVVRVTATLRADQG